MEEKDIEMMATSEEGIIRRSNITGRNTAEVVPTGYFPFEETKVHTHPTSERIAENLNSCAECWKCGKEGNVDCNCNCVKRAEEAFSKSELDCSTTTWTLTALATTFAANFADTLSSVGTGLNLASAESGGLAFLFSTAANNKQHRDTQSKIDLLDKKFDLKIDLLDKKFDKKFDLLDKKFDKKFDWMDKKFEKSELNAELRDYKSDLRELKAELKVLQQTPGSNSDDIEEKLKEIKDMKDHMDGLTEKINKINQEIGAGSVNQLKDQSYQVQGHRLV